MTKKSSLIPHYYSKINFWNYLRTNEDSDKTNIMVTNTYSSPWNSSTLANNPKDNKIMYSTTYNTSKVSCLKNVEMCNPGRWESTKSVSASWKKN